MPRAAKPKIKMSDLKVGYRITYKAGGKVSRLEGMAGKVVPATITFLDPKHDIIHVMPDYRKKPGAEFRNMGGSLDLDQILTVTVDK